MSQQPFSTCLAVKVAVKTMAPALSSEPDTSMVKSKAAKAAKKATQKPSKLRAPARDKDSAAATSEDQLPAPLQQILLDIFKDTCVAGTASDIGKSLQEIKGHLYNRDFAAAFGKDEYLRVYAARWSPSRALGYAHIFHDLENFLFEKNVPLIDSPEIPLGARLENVERVDVDDKGSKDVASISDQLITSLRLDLDARTQSDNIGVEYYAPLASAARCFKVACLGGGAGAEIVGLAGWLGYLGERSRESSTETSASHPLDFLEVSCYDMANWDVVVKDLYEHCVAPPKLSKYASAATQASNSALLPSDTLQVTFQQQDVLEYSPAEVNSNFSNTDLVTLMFTLNELYSTSVSKAQHLLRNLTANMREGAFLLVVDSPGSYSAVTINGAERKYPMQWLLDHTLLDPPSKASGLKPQVLWEKLVSDESRWFRLQKESLKYPIDLENMRYQIHLYRRCNTHT